MALFQAEFTSPLGQYGSQKFRANTYEQAYLKAASMVRGTNWALIAVAPVSEKQLKKVPLGEYYHEVIAMLNKARYFRHGEKK